MSTMARPSYLIVTVYFIILFKTLIQNYEKVENLPKQADQPSYPLKMDKATSWK